jgi:hypothetical protein
MTDQERQARRALALLRGDRRAAVRQRRRDRPWDVRMYPWYVAILVLGYLTLFLSGTSRVRIGETKIAGTAAGGAATACIGALLALLAIATVGACVAAAIHAGPVVLWPEDARVLLPSPVSRAALLRRQLLIAYARAAALAALTSGVLVLVEVALLSQSAARALPGAIVMPQLVGLAAVAAGWLVQALPVLKAAARTIFLLVVTLMLWVGGSVALELGRHGQLAGWARLHRLGRLPGMSFLRDAGQPGTSSARLVVSLAVFAAAALALAAVGWNRAGRVTAEQVFARAGRAVAVRTALRLGYTSSAYVVRTGPARRQRTHRRYLKFRGRNGALLSKAALQEQGASILGRITLAAVGVAVLDAGLFARAPITTKNPVLAGGLLAGIVFAVLATRYADSLRIDVELSTPATALPAPLGRVAGADLAVPAAIFAVGAALAAPALALLQLQPWTRVPVLLLFGVLLGPAAAAVAGLSATGNNPSPFLPSAAATAFRLRGLISSIVMMVGVAFTLHPPALRGVQHAAPTAAAAVVTIALLDGVLIGLGLWSGKVALIRAR